MILKNSLSSQTFIFVTSRFTTIYPNTACFSQLQECQTLRYIYMNNSALCYEATERVVQHIVHCIESQGRHVEYLRLLQTLVKAEGQSIRKTQDMVMAEVCMFVSKLVNR